MAYETTNPPAIIANRIGSGSGNVFYYNDGDAIADVLATGYFTDGYALGMRVGDQVMFSDSTNGKAYTLYCSVATAAGACTVTNQATDLGSSSIISGSGATVTLTAEQSGKKVLFDRAAGIVFTLPAPVVGLKYYFDTTVSLTSNAYAIVTDAATTFVVGAVNGAIEAAATGEVHFANGSTHVGISSNATTTGGLIGGWLEFECLSTTLWSVKGTLSCTATPATPFTT